MDHDQRFKLLLQEFFPDFFALFFPAWRQRLDFSQVEWLGQETFPDPPQGRRHLLDLVAKLAVRQPVPSPRPGEAESLLALVHVEIEAEDSVNELRGRFFDYYQDLRRRHRLPVLPVALYLRVGLEGVGVDQYAEDFHDLDVLRFRYLYVGLPALPAREYLQGDNWLGVALAALMRIEPERRAWLGAEALRRLVQCPENAWRRFMLADCVQAYLPLQGAQVQEFEQLLASEPYREVQPMRATWYDEGMLKGREEGQREGQRLLLEALLEERFGPLGDRARERLQALPADRLTALARALLRAQSLRELGLED